MASGFRLLDLARLVVDEINSLLDNGALLYSGQLREAAESISANVREAYGRRRGRDRNRFLIFARGSAEEADEHIRANHAARRLASPQYWRIHHRITVTVRMLNSLMDSN